MDGPSSPATAPAVPAPVPIAPIAVESIVEEEPEPASSVSDVPAVKVNRMEEIQTFVRFLTNEDKFGKRRNIDTRFAGFNVAEKWEIVKIIYVKDLHARYFVLDLSGRPLLSRHPRNDKRRNLPGVRRYQSRFKKHGYASEFAGRFVGCSNRSDGALPGEKYLASGGTRGKAITTVCIDPMNKDNVDVRTMLEAGRYARLKG